MLLLIVGSVRGQSEEPSQEAVSCHNEFQAKISSTTAFRQGLKLANNEVRELEASINDTLDVLEAANRTKIQLERELMSKQEYVEVLGTYLQNLTTEVQELNTTCDTVLAKDCCQVDEYYIVMIIA